MTTDAALISGNFDEGAFLRHALQMPSSESEKLRLAHCIESVQERITSLVGNCHSVLLGHLDSLQSAEKSVQGIRGRADALQSSAARLRHTIEDPHELIRTKMNQLENSMKCVDLLRQVHRFLALHSKLPEVIDTDLIRAARILKEMDEILATKSLTGIDVVDQQVEFVRVSFNNVKMKANDALKKALVSKNQAECGVAMQCLISIDQLPQAIKTVVGEHTREALMSIQKRLDVTILSDKIQSQKNVQDSQGSMEERGKGFVFTALQETLDGLADHCGALAVLWRVFHRRKDTETHLTFAQTSPLDVTHPLEEFWHTVVNSLKKKLCNLVRQKKIRDVMISEFAKAFKMLRVFCESISDFLRETKREASTADSALAELSSESLYSDLLKDILSDLQREFAAQSIDKQHDKLKVIFNMMNSAPLAASQNVPLTDYGAPRTAANAIDSRPLLKHITQEITANRQEPAALAIVLTYSVQTFSQLFTKMNECVNRHVTSVHTFTASSVTAGQIYAASLVNVAGNVATEIAGWMPDFSGLDGSETAARSCKQLKELAEKFRELCNRVISPFFSEASKTLSRLVGEIAQASDIDASRRTFDKSVENFSHFARLFDRSTGVDSFSQRLAATLLQVCAISVCASAPTSEPRRQKVISLITDIEGSVSMLSPIERVVVQQRVLRAVRHLLSVSLEDLQQHLEVWKARIHPLLVGLLLFQMVDASQLKPLHRAIRCACLELIEIVQDAVISEESKNSGTLLWGTMSKCMQEYEERGDLEPDDSAKRSVVLCIFQGLR